MTPPTALCVFAFLLALCVNIALGPVLGQKSKTASKKAVRKGGLNPDLWAFAIWAILYTAFAVGYVMWVRDGSHPLPWALTAAWMANIAWLLASCADQWLLALGLILVYMAASLASIQGLKTMPGVSPPSHSLGVLNVATASLTVWLVAATLLNVQIVEPRYARSVKLVALPVLFAFALFLVFRSSSFSDFPGCFSCAIACTVIWICVALDDNPSSATLASKQQSMHTEEAAAKR